MVVFNFQYVLVVNIFIEIGDASLLRVDDVCVVRNDFSGGLR